MLHFKFQGHNHALGWVMKKKILKGFTIHGRGGPSHANQLHGQIIVPPSHGFAMCNLALIGHAVSKEDFENDGHVDVYRQWQTIP